MSGTDRREGISELLHNVMPDTFLSCRVLCAALIVAIIFWLIFDTAKQGSHQLISFGGLVMYILLMFIFSKYPTRVST